MSKSTLNGLLLPYIPPNVTYNLNFSLGDRIPPDTPSSTHLFMHPLTSLYLLPLANGYPDWNSAIYIKCILAWQTCTVIMKLPCAHPKKLIQHRTLLEFWIVFCKLGSTNIIWCPPSIFFSGSAPACNNYIIIIILIL